MKRTPTLVSAFVLAALAAVTAAAQTAEDIVRRMQSNQVYDT